MFCNLILFIFAVIGMTHIIVDGAIFNSIRSWLEAKLPANIFKLFNCYQCCGTWAGFICGTILISYNPFVVFMCACAGSFLAMWGATYLNYLEAKTLISIQSEGDEQ